jgi:alkaline phosphatase D
MLGEQQEAWLGEGLSGGARWNLIAQQVMVMPFAYPTSRAAGVVNRDSWSGYPEARQRLIAAIQERKLTNVGIASGDVHKHHVGVLPSREGDLASAPVAAEYVCTSISSGGDGADLPVGWEGVPDANPHTSLVSDRRGYQLFDISPKAWRTDLIAVDRVSTAGGARRKLASFVAAPGKPGAEPA